MMKKNSILAMLMVLIAALFGSSLVACSNLSSGSSGSGSEDSDNPAFEATLVDGTPVEFLPVIDSNPPTKDGNVYSIEGYKVVLAINDTAINSSTFKDSENVKNRIREDNLFHNKYIIIRYVEDNTNALYELEITDTGDVLLKKTWTRTEPVAK